MDEGLLHIAEAENAASGYVARVRGNTQSGCLEVCGQPAYPNATNLTADQMVREAIYRYNVGFQDSYWKWDPNTGTWLAAPTLAPIYVDRVVACK